MSEEERQEAHFKMDCATNELRNQEFQHSMAIRQEQHEKWLEHKAIVEACLAKSQTLSFRDQAAIAALNALMQLEVGDDFQKCKLPDFCSMAFCWADAMNAERLKRGDK